MAFHCLSLIFIDFHLFLLVFVIFNCFALFFIIFHSFLSIHCVWTGLVLYVVVVGIISQVDQDQDQDQTRGSF